MLKIDSISTDLLKTKELQFDPSQIILGSILFNNLNSFEEQLQGNQVNYVKPPLKRQSALKQIIPKNIKIFRSNSFDTKKTEELLNVCQIRRQSGTEKLSTKLINLNQKFPQSCIPQHIKMQKEQLEKKRIRKLIFLNMRTKILNTKQNDQDQNVEISIKSSEDYQSTGSSPYDLKFFQTNKIEQQNQEKQFRYSIQSNQKKHIINTPPLRKNSESKFTSLSPIQFNEKQQFHLQIVRKGRSKIYSKSKFSELSDQKSLDELNQVIQNKSPQLMKRVKTTTSLNHLPEIDTFISKTPKKINKLNFQSIKKHCQPILSYRQKQVLMQL